MPTNIDFFLSWLSITVLQDYICDRMELNRPAKANRCYAKELVCAIFFGSRKDEMSGEVPVAFIVQAAGFNLSEEDVKAFIAKQVDFMF